VGQGDPGGQHQGGMKRLLMKLPHRRQVLHLAAGAGALLVVPRIAWAQAYPSRPVRLIVPFPAAGPSDVLARLYGQKLSQPSPLWWKTGSGQREPSARRRW
jgi:hypothetical protein